MTANNGRNPAHINTGVPELPLIEADLPPCGYVELVINGRSRPALFLGTASNGKELGDLCDIMRQIAGARENRHIPRLSVQEVIDAGLWPEGE